MHNLALWETSQQSAKTPEDWSSTDTLAIEIARRGFSDIFEAREALRLALVRLRGSEDLPIEPGDPSEVWIQHVLKAAWTSLAGDSNLQNGFWALPFAAHSIRRDNTMVGVSRSWCNLLGYQPDEVLGKRSVEFLTEASRAYAVSTVLPEFWRTGLASNVEYDMVHKNGQVVPINMSACCEMDAEGRALRSLAVISERR